VLTRSLPCLRQLKTLCLGRDQEEDENDYEDVDDFGDHDQVDEELSEEDGLAIGRGAQGLAPADPQAYLRRFGV
jgi:hypothetical protein